MTDHLTDEQLNELLDASPRHPPSLTRHLGTCVDCRSRLEELRAVFTVLESLPEVRLPHDLTTSVLARLPERRIPLAWKWLVAAQVLSALAIAVWLSSSFELPATILAYQPPTLDSTLAALFTFLSSINFHPSSFIPYPSFLDLQSTTIILLVASAGALWVIGNGLLLRAPAKRFGK